MTTTPALPPAGTQTSADHRAIALRFLSHAQVELDRGNRLQAGEKAWGAVAHQLKAVAIDRKWDHESHYLFSRMVGYLTKEYDLNDDLRHWEATTDNRGHRNFYENERSAEDVQNVIKDARAAVATIEELHTRPSRPYTIESESQQNAVEALTGWRFEQGHRRATGFVNLPTPPVPPGQRERRQHFQWKDHYPDDPENPSSGGGSGQRPPNPPPQGETPGGASSHGRREADPEPVRGGLKAAFEKMKAKADMGRALGGPRRALRKRRQAPASQGERAAPATNVEVIYK